MGGHALGALGLRGRIVGAVLVTAVTALAVAAVVLLGPLAHSLRNADLTTLEQQVPAGSAAALSKLDPSLAYYARTSPGYASPKAKAARQAIVTYEKELYRRTQASEVAVLGYADASGHNFRVISVWPDEDLTTGDPFDDAAKVFLAHTRKRWPSLGSINGTQYARVAVPFVTKATYGPYHVKQRWVLIVRKSLVEVSSAFAAVRTAFLVAALVALALTLILGIPLSARLVRRLRVLRHAALRLAHGGPEVQIPVDRARDEVGDLARSFAIMQTQLQHQEEARRAFVATASHELRTPLATLDGMLEMLQEDLRSGDPDLDDAQSLVDRARAQSHRLGRLAADLLDLSRIDAQVDLRSEPVELGELSRAVLAEFELGTAERQIATALDDTIGPVWAMGDPGSVARIVRILIDNAVRLSPDHARITIELRNGDRASLSVCDEGPGVPAEERELIFERFMRGRQVVGPPGFGLGLAIGRELAERMGGELVLEDQDGPGARFTLRLPVAHAPDAEPAVVA